MVITDGTRIKSNWFVLPVEKVGTDGVPPVHRAPHGVVGVVLSDYFDFDHYDHYDHYDHNDSLPAHLVPEKGLRTGIGKIWYWS